MEIIKFILCMILSFVVDLPYLYINADLFKKKTMEISGKDYPKNRLYSAVLVYVAIALGIMVFVLPKIDTTKTTMVRLNDSLLYGGLFGMVSYAIFDFTTHFMYEGWSIYVSIMDTLWGGLLCAIVSFIISYY
jgi:uncharacterized membrane protein